MISMMQKHLNIWELLDFKYMKLKKFFTILHILNIFVFVFLLINYSKINNLWFINLFITFYLALFLLIYIIRNKLNEKILMLIVFIFYFLFTICLFYTCLKVI